MRQFPGAPILGIALAVACQGPEGPAGPAGPTGPEGPEGPSASVAPTINGITPWGVYLGRTVQVTLSGSASRWTTAATIDFGDGIDVVDWTVASPTAIVATLEIDEEAAVGTRDVSVTDGGETSTFSGAFWVQAPISLTGALGTVAQGSLVFGRIDLEDLSTPFDATSTGDGLFTPIAYPNLAVAGGVGTWAEVQAATPFDVEVLFFIDVTANAGWQDVEVWSGQAGQDTVSVQPDAMEIATRTPTPLTNGMVTGSVATPFATTLYSYTPEADAELVTFAIAADDETAVPGVAVIPASGSWTELLDFTDAGSLVVDETVYLVVWDNFGSSGYDYAIDFDAQAVGLGADVEPNDTCASATSPAAVPFFVQEGSLDDIDDVDWYAITVPAAEVGRTLHVVTSSSTDPYTDTVVEVFSGCGSSFYGASDDFGYHEDWYAGPVESAGTYYVEVSNSSWGWNSPGYDLTVTLEE